MRFLSNFYNPPFLFPPLIFPTTKSDLFQVNYPQSFPNNPSSVFMFLKFNPDTLFDFKNCVFLFRLWNFNSHRCCFFLFHLFSQCALFALHQLCKPSIKEKNRVLSRYLKIKLCHFAFVFALSQFFFSFSFEFFFRSSFIMKVNSEEKGIINGGCLDVLGYLEKFWRKLKNFPSDFYVDVWRLITIFS